MTLPYPADPADAPWALLARHLAAEATAAERAGLRAWVQADPAHLQILATVTRAWERAGEAAAGPVLFTPADVAAAWERFRPLMAAAAPPAAPAPGPAGPVVRPLWAGPGRGAARRWQLAAGLALLLGAGYALASTWFSGPQELVRVYASARRPPAGAAARRQHRVAQRALAAALRRQRARARPGPAGPCC